MKKTILTLTACLLLGMMAQAQSLTKGLVGYWSFEDSTYRDQSSLQNDGSWQNSRPVFIKGSTSKFALRFSGGNEYLSASDDPSLNIGTTGGFTVSFWMNIDSSEANYTQPRVLIAKRLNASGNTDYIFFTEGKKFYFGTGNSTDTVAWMSIPRPSLGVWHHVVGISRYDSSTSRYIKKLYIDNNLVRSGTTTVKGSAVSSELTFGMGSYGGTPVYYKGGLDEIRFYDRELSATEVTALNTLTALSNETKTISAITIGNPFGDRLRLFGLDASFTGVLTLRDIQGKVLVNQLISANGNSTVEIALPQQLSAGFYTCSLQSQSGVQAFKLVKE